MMSRLRKGQQRCARAGPRGAALCPSDRSLLQAADEGDPLAAGDGRLCGVLRSWDEPYGVWEAPAIPAVLSDTRHRGFLQERRGVTTDTSSGILLQPVPQEAYIPKAVPFFELGLPGARAPLPPPRPCTEPPTLVDAYQRRSVCRHVQEDCHLVTSESLSP